MVFCFPRKRDTVPKQSLEGKFSLPCRQEPGKHVQLSCCWTLLCYSSAVRQLFLFPSTCSSLTLGPLPPPPPPGLHSSITPPQRGPPRHPSPALYIVYYLPLSSSPLRPLGWSCLLLGDRPNVSLPTNTLLLWEAGILSVPSLTAPLGGAHHQSLTNLCQQTAKSKSFEIQPRS
jgi:hypothetical protein